MDNDIATFLAFTGTEDSATAKRFLDITGNNVEYAVQLFLESGATGGAPSNNDEDVAQRLQQEAYQENVREADTSVHRHETLMDSFSGFGMPNMDRPQDIFGTGRVGVFNQRFDVEEDFDDDDDEDDDYGEPRVVELDDDDDDDVVVNDDDEDVIDVDEESPRPNNRRSRARHDRLAELTSTQRRLAQLFKPPFDLIERTNLDGAKLKGRSEKKWILVNIQDQSEFQCQVLNRDFWSQPNIKNTVKENFIFLQYQHDSPNGESYSNFYHVDGYPHISILDPLTGERVKKWTDGEVPKVDDWLSDVELFLEKFSLHPNSNNPTVEHDVKFDPDAMTEEQQIEYAMKQSVANKGTNADDAINVDGDDDDDIDAKTSTETQNNTSDPFDNIQPQDHSEPSSQPQTRIQFRFPNGKRLIHKFNPADDTILTIYGWLKFVLKNAEESAYGISSDDKFTLSSVGKPRLLDILNESIENAGLKNASILLEKD